MRIVVLSLCRIANFAPVRHCTLDSDGIKLHRLTVTAASRSSPAQKPKKLADQTNETGKTGRNGENAKTDKAIHRMTPAERKSAFSLASLYALRTLGLFLVLPVFALAARQYPGGQNPALVGLALGIYGLTQACLQIPYGWASDRLGRKRVIIAGLIVFAAGSFIAAAAPNLMWLLVGRAIQGAGAISAAVTALVADQTREVVRTKAMALVGASIGVMFAIALVAAPPLAAHIGLKGIFLLTAILAIAGIAVVLFWVPAEPANAPHHAGAPLRLKALWAERDLLRLNMSVFALHTIQLAMWVAVPSLLVQAGLIQAHQWWVYLPAVVISFLVMGGVLFPMERRGQLRLALRGAVALVALAQAALLAIAWRGNGIGGIAPLAVVLLIFFCGFNALEASQPSLVSRLAPAPLRGSALGVFNTLQSLGLFAGGTLGGLLVKVSGTTGLFSGTLVLSLVWLAVIWGLKPVSQRSA
jgi:MFS family permease